MLTSIDHLAMALDRVRFAQACCPSMVFDAWQVQALRSQHLRLLFNVHRQGGKSLVCGLIALHCALYEADSPVLCVSPTLRQSQELFRVILDLYRAVGKPVAPAVENKLSLELVNHSRILSLPGSEDTVRGISRVRLAICDEGSRVPAGMLAAVRPMLATSGGRLISPSTPNGRQGWWYDAWTNGGETWERYMVKASGCPRISPAFLADELATYGPGVFAREYECSFDDNDLSVFPEALLQRCMSTEHTSWSNKLPKANWAAIAAQAQATS